MKLLQELMAIHEGSRSIPEIAKDAVYQADKWLPDDPEEQKEFFSSDENEQRSFINEFIDEYFNRYMNMRQDGAWVSANREKIIAAVAKEFAG